MTILKALLPTLFEVSLHSECEMKHSAESTIEAVSASSLLFKKPVSEFDQPDFTPNTKTVTFVRRPKMKRDTAPEWNAVIL